MEDNVILEKIRELTAQALSGAGVELVDLTYRHESGGMVMRFTVDKGNGISIGECSMLSRRIEGVLEEAGIIESHYMLEVQSPGLDRKLAKTGDFERVIGKELDIVLSAPVDGKWEYSAPLKWVGEDSIKIELSDGNEVVLPRDVIVKAKLHLDF
ncbi:MAG: ribosome maturation factor RimP [Candidatus Omnitrophica bacterium]|nr:ribosome maturation factor RimP [Candidatus Omnitrophota bacterium]